MIKKFIDRPVLSTVITIFIVLFGILGITILPVTQYPDIAPPTILISANYTGADAETVLKSVIIPIEEQVNGVENMTYISSTADNSGKAKITVYFKQGTDPDIATVNVQNRVARANSLLPQEVIKSGITTQKQNSSALMFLSFYSKNKKLDDVFLQNYVNINIISGIKRINGVGDASIMGAKDYSMRIWLDPQKLANYNLVPADVTRAINEQSSQAALGQLGQNSGESFQYVLKYKGKLNEVDEYKNIIVKNGENGELVHLNDVADIELGAFSYSDKGETNGNPSLTMAIYQTPGSNAQVIIKDIIKFLEINKVDFPEGIEYVINYDTNEFLDASMEKVMHTLFEAFLLVFLVVFIFLQDFKSTIIPAITVPVSLVGTFFFINLLGFSINLLTLFALILAIGIVVDDAIVVVEAVHAKMDKEKGKSVKTITTEAMGEITGAIISITLVMSAVFIPISFISGPSGVFFKQFGLTLFISIIISAVNALTLSPMLCALILKPHHDDNHKKIGLLQRFYNNFNTAFESLTNQYGKIVRKIINHKIIAFVLIIFSILIIYWANKTTPSGFVPNEDRKLIFGNIELAPGATLERTYNVLKQISDQTKNIEGIESITYIAGNSLINGSGNNNGLLFAKLEDWSVRKSNSEKSIERITQKLFGLTSSIRDAKIIFFSPPSVPGFGTGSGFELSVLDKTGGSSQDLDNAAQKFISELMTRPEILYAQSPFNTKYPQYELIVNVDAAKQKGINVNDIFSAMSGYIGGVYAADFIKYGKQFRVMVQSSPENRTDISSINKLYVRNSSGEMAPISGLVELQKVYGPQQVSRFNLYSSASINGSPKPGYSTGDAIKAINEVAEKSLPNGYGIDYSGLTREEINAGSQTTAIYIITIIFVFLLLAIQYESYVLPFSILLSLPFGVMGAFLSQKLAGLENNIFFQIAIIMLIGLLAKNAILIVEFALIERKSGKTIVEAAIAGAKERLRPILMTSFAFILGLMPLVLSSGVGSLGNKSLATGSAFGLLIGTFLGILIIPALFVIFQTIDEKIKPLNKN